MCILIPFLLYHLLLVLFYPYLVFLLEQVLGPLLLLLQLTCTVS